MQGHVAKVFEEGRLTQTQLVVYARQRHHFVQEVCKRQDQFDDIFAHHLEQSSDLEGSHAEDIERVVLLGPVLINLLDDEVLEGKVVALAK